MPMINVYKCPKTKKLFESKKAYTTHLKKIAKQNIENKKYKEKRQYLRDIIDNAYKTKDVQDLVNYIVKYQKEIMLYYCLDDTEFREVFKKGHTKFECPELLELKANTYYSTEVSNSHHAPKGKSTNWSRKLRLPLGYPGWTGRMSAQFKGESAYIYPIKGQLVRYRSYPNSRLFNELFNTGSGGGVENIQYDVRFFADDFPLWEETQDEKHALKILEEGKMVMIPENNGEYYAKHIRK